MLKIHTSAIVSGHACGKFAVSIGKRHTIYSIYALWYIQYIVHDKLFLNYKQLN